jgi:hypothetical protein
MENQNKPKVNRPYLILVILLMLVLPVISIISEYSMTDKQISLIELGGKWFVFWSIGLRQFTAGIRQSTKPSFTAETIFNITNKESFVIVKELGFANICLGSIGIISLFLPGWLMASAFAGGLFMGIAGINHMVKKPAGLNEWIAMGSDIFIAVIMAAYIIFHSYVAHS